MLHISPASLIVMVAVLGRWSDPALYYSHNEGSNRNMLWPNGVIPFTFDKSVERRPTVRGAMNQWAANTCVRFIERTNETHYVEFQYKQNEGCNTRVGYHRKPRQIVTLGPGCFHDSKVLHEIGHVLGFYHEQSRPDRDEYVEIYEENIRDGYLNAFDKYGSDLIDTLGLEYDYNSIMHYKMKDSSKNGGFTILPKKKGIKELGNDHLSPLDIKRTNLLYKCRGWTSWSQWNACDKSCEGGTQERRRRCTVVTGGQCEGPKLENRMCNLQACPDWPKFPADFSFGDPATRQSFDIEHLRAHRHKEDECLLISEKENLQDWSTYFFCNMGDRKIDMKWSDRGPIRGMKCIHIFEPRDRRGWHDNYLCFPPDAPYNLTWFNDGKKENMTCVRWYAKSGAHGWNDNFLCTEGDGRPVNGSWSDWSQWSECKTECGPGKRHRVRSCTRPRPQNGGRACIGSDLEEEHCNKSACRKNFAFSYSLRRTAKTMPTYIFSRCGGELKGTIGNFSSPYFPRNYTSNTNCTWTIKCRPRKHIYITIRSMNIEKAMGTCKFDYLKIKDDNYNGKELGTFCGDKLPDMIVSTSHAVWISFVTDGQDNRSGFFASWIHD